MENIENRIVTNPDILLGKPIIKGTRISVELTLNLLSEGASTDDVIDMYPHLVKEDIKAALRYASSLVAHEETLEVK
jgi:uncharacterized protein (DUF433 family)